eukprot:gb/GECG01002836.1/.p1 GENE.gb/GECG01002836.1/~~gb/GECG01002836.1/.p1  ORF type:complete len:271 (+),score=40.10 gb/GECG01002836.1/:1-813(+)
MASANLDVSLDDLVISHGGGNQRGGGGRQRGGRGGGRGRGRGSGRGGRGGGRGPANFPIGQNFGDYRGQKGGGRGGRAPRGGRGGSRMRQEMAKPYSFGHDDRLTGAAPVAPQRELRRNDRDPDLDNVWVHDKFYQEGPAQSAPQGRGSAKPPITLGKKVEIANLDSDIGEEELTSLFERVGPVKSAKVHFNALGQPKGTAEVAFQTLGDAKKAVEEFDQREVNGRAIVVKLMKGATATEGQSNGDSQTASSRPVRGRGSVRGRREIRMI